MHAISIEESLFIYIYSNLFNSSPKIQNRSQSLFYKLKEASKLYKEVEKKNNWSNTFFWLIESLDSKLFNNLVVECPLEILTRSKTKLFNFKDITAFELAALSCEEKATTQNQHKKEWKDSSEKECWYTSDDFSAKCIHHSKGERCPLSIPPNLSKVGLHISPKDISLDMDYLREHHLSILDNINKPFDPKHFSDNPSYPISLGSLEDKDTFSKWGPVPQAQNLPIKMPFTDYRLPKNLQQFEELIQKIADFWHAVNPDYGNYYYCYFSVAQSHIPSGSYQRRGHIHSDGFQSHWIKPKLFSDVSFIVSDTSSTEFFFQPFDTSSLNPSIHNYFRYFKKNVKLNPERLRRPYEVLAMDAYTLHRAIRNESSRTIRRTFVRVMFSVIRWQSKHNAHNPMFEYQWPSRERTLLSKLI